MRGLPGTSRTPARAGRTDRTAAWRVAAVAVLLALTAAGLRSRGTFSHAPDRVLAGASGTVLATALAATEGVALVAFVLVLAVARPRRKPKPDEDEPPRLPFPWWAKTLAVLAAVAVLVTPFAVLFTRQDPPEDGGAGPPRRPGQRRRRPSRLPAPGTGSPWPLIAGMLIALALARRADLLVPPNARRHRRGRPGTRPACALGESLAAGRAALAGRARPAGGDHRVLRRDGARLRRGGFGARRGRHPGRGTGPGYRGRAGPVGFGRPRWPACSAGPGTAPSR